MKIRPVILTCMLFSLLFLASCASQAVVTEPQAADMTPAESMLTRAALPVTWETTAAAWIGMHGHQQDLVLPPGGVSRPIYGSGMFRYDSSIGSAAVSLGLITYEQGGTVTIEIREGPEYIKGDSSQEGWSTVFVFLDAESKPIMPPVPPETIKLQIPDTDEPIQSTETPQPAWFTVLNATTNKLTYHDNYTNHKLAVDDHG
jgi:hypothetical protein